MTSMVAAFSLDLRFSIVGGSEPPRRLVAYPAVLYSRLPIDMIVDGLIEEFCNDSLLVTFFLTTLV